MNGKTAKMLMSGGNVVVEWMHKVCVHLWKSGKVLDVWTGTLIVPLSKGGT